MWVLASLLLRPLPPPEPPEPPEPEHPIVVARRTLTPGERIDAEDLVTIDFPPGLLPHTALTRAQDVVGLYVRERVVSGEPIREERLFEPDREPTSAEDALGWWGAVPVDLFLDSVPSGLSVKNFVDVIATRDGLTATVAQGALVVGLAPERVTVAVSSLAHPALVERLEGATIAVVLRSDIDVTHIETHGERAKPRLVSGRWAEPAPRPPCREPDPYEDLYPFKVCGGTPRRLPLCRPVRRAGIE